LPQRRQSSSRRAARSRSALVLAVVSVISSLHFRLWSPDPLFVVARSAKRHPEVRAERASKDDNNEGHPSRVAAHARPPQDDEQADTRNPFRDALAPGLCSIAPARERQGTWRAARRGPSMAHVPRGDVRAPHGAP
jgi:hypothetical protein